MSKFQQRINELIERYDGNLTQYARRIDVSINQLYAYRSGKSEAEFDVLLRISEIENVSLDWLLGSNYHASSQAYSDEQIKLLQDFGALNQAGKDELFKFVAYLLSKPENKKKVVTA